MLFCAKKKLSHLDNPRLEAEILLSDLLDLGRAELRTRGDLKLSWLHRHCFFVNVRKRAKGEPLAYIRGWQEWAGMKLNVSPAVLIPRDETEYLLEKISGIENPKSILDVGTGSGCLALGLAKRFPDAEVSALDYSTKALRVARSNFKKYKADVNVLHSDLLAKIKKGARYDLIVANLPYVPTNIEVTREVEKEPQDAIFSGDDGLDLLRRFSFELEQKEVSFAALWLEFLPCQWPDIEKMFSKWHVEPVRDLGGDIYFAKISQSM